VYRSSAIGHRIFGTGRPRRTDGAVCRFRDCNRAKSTGTPVAVVRPSVDRSFFR